jgi:hypothetical protein
MNCWVTYNEQFPLQKPNPTPLGFTAPGRKAGASITTRLVGGSPLDGGPRRLEGLYLHEFSFTKKLCYHALHQQVG